MLHAFPHWFFWGWVLCASVGSSIGAEVARGNGAEHTWKPMADWYEPDLRQPKLAPRSVEQSELRIHLRDDPRWAEVDWDDSTWTVIDRTRVPLGAGIFWLRVRVRTTGRDEQMPSLILLSGGSALEVYWDGALVNSSGSPGNNRQAEIAGTNLVKFELPANMTEAGEHVVALRMSNYRGKDMSRGFSALYFLTLELKQYHALSSKLSLLMGTGAGAMLAIGVALFVIWGFADRRTILALLSALCLSAALLVAVASAPIIWVYPASWGSVQVTLRISMVVLVCSLLLAVVIAHFYPSWRRRWLLLPLIVESAIASFWFPLGVNALTPLLWRVAFISGLLFVGWAVWRRREGSWLVMAGLATTAALFQRDPKHFEHIFIFGFIPVTIGLIAAIALQLRRERLQARDTKLMAARLEIELLKKSLQPHFLMNTLTALSQVIEEKPAAAVRLIDDLAIEFRALTRFSGEKQVSIADELALCRAHLGVMSARTDLTWSLVAEGIDASASVPPALFLTLIENGFSHQRTQKDATMFTLRAEPMGDGTRYTFLSPGTVTLDTNRVIGGTGLRYVYARLEESFHNAWKLTHGSVPGGWETVIELRHTARRGANI